MSNEKKFEAFFAFFDDDVHLTKFSQQKQLVKDFNENSSNQKSMRNVFNSFVFHLLESNFVASLNIDFFFDIIFIDFDNFDDNSLLIMLISFSQLLVSTMSTTLFTQKSLS